MIVGIPLISVHINPILIAHTHRGDWPVFIANYTKVQ